MYAQRQIYPYHLGFPSLPQTQRTAYNQGSPGSVTTGPGRPQQQQSPMSGLSGQLTSAALRQYLNQPSGYTGAQSLAATDAADAASPYGSDALLANGADPGIMSQLAAGTPYEATPVMGEGAESGLGLLGGDAATTGTAAGSTAAAGTAAGAGAADAAAAGTAADTSLAASGLLGADAAGTGLAGAETAGLLGGGAAAGEGAAAATAAGEGTAAAVGATNFWNPVGWAALAGLAAYQLGLFD